MSFSYEEPLSTLDTLNSMFSAPWTKEHLNTILQHFNGNMEHTVDAVLSHGDDTPQRLLYKLSNSKVDPDEMQDVELAKKLATLNSMFSAPWTKEYLNTVLHYFNGNMEKTVDAVLSHGDGTPQRLLYKIYSKIGPDEMQDIELAKKLALEPHPPTTRRKRDALNTVLQQFNSNMEKTVNSVLSHGNGKPQRLMHKIFNSKVGPDEIQDAKLAKKLAWEQHPPTMGGKKDAHVQLQKEILAELNDDMLSAQAAENEISEEEERKALCREAVASCMQTILEHLSEFLGERPDATYEEWIEELHPDNTDDQAHSNVGFIDHRFYVDESHHRIVWNDHMDTFATNVTNQDSFLNRKVQSRYKHGAPLHA